MDGMRAGGGKEGRGEKKKRVQGAFHPLHPSYVLSLLFNFHLVKILEVIFGDAHAAFHFFL